MHAQHANTLKGYINYTKLFRYIGLTTLLTKPFFHMPVYY